MNLEHVHPVAIFGSDYVADKICICCFCGRKLPLREASAVLIHYPNDRYKAGSGNPEEWCPRSYGYIVTCNLVCFLLGVELCYGDA